MIKRQLKRLAAFLFLFFPLLLDGQHTGISSYFQQQGLHSSFTYRISQDKEGFIWIGSDNGVFRFDGVHFKQFSQKEGIRNIDVLHAIPLADGSIFIAPFQNDFAVYKKGKIINADNDSELAKLNSDHYARLVSRIRPDKKEICFAPSAFVKVLYFYHAGKVTVCPVKIDYRKLGLKNVLFIDYDFKGNLFLGGGHFFYKYNIRTQKLTLVSSTFDIGESYNFTEMSGGRYVAFSSQEVRILTAHKKLHSYRFKENIYWAIPTKDNRVWVSFTSGGIACFDLKKHPDFKSPVYFMPDYIVNDVMTDRDGNTWFSTKNSGVFFMHKALFDSYMQLPAIYRTSSLTTISGNSGAIVFGYTDGKIAVLKNRKLFPLPFAQQPKMECRAIAQNGKYVVMGYDMQLCQAELGPKGNKTMTHPGSITVKQIIPYKDNFLVCSAKDLTIYDPRSMKFSMVLEQKTYCVLPFSEDSLFAGSFRDLYKVNMHTKSRRLFLKGYYFTELKKIDPHLYIGATNGNGLIIFNDRGIVQKITADNGLTSDQVKHIEVENAYTYWASTNLGLCRISRKNGKTIVSRFTRSDGLPSDRVIGCVVRNDTVYAGTADGLAILPVKKLLHQSSYIHKKVIINSVTIGDSSYFGPAGPLTTYAQNNVTINLSFLDYVSQGNVSYRYSIEGLNNVWQTSTSSKINLNALPPGIYIFKVYGVSYNGKRSKYYTALRLEVKPLFWQTLWFRGILFILLVTFIYFIARYLFLRKKDKKVRTLEFEKKIAELELQAIKAQMNPHFVYNCLNSIQYLLYKQDYKETRNYLDVFTKMIRKTLFYSEKTFMSVREETEYLELYMEMEKLRFADNFSYSIRISEGVNQQWRIPSLLIQPFVENSLKHGISKVKDKQGRIDVLFAYTGSELVITIRDNGVGFGDRELKLSESFGIRLSQKRIDTFRQLFHVPIRLGATNHPEGGAMITLYLPIDEQHD